MQRYPPGCRLECDELFAWCEGLSPPVHSVGLGYAAPIESGYGCLTTRTFWSTASLEGVGTWVELVHVGPGGSDTQESGPSTSGTTV